MIFRMDDIVCGTVS